MSDPNIKVTSMINPAAFLAMSEEDKAAYLAKLTPEEQASFQAQVATMDPTRNSGPVTPIKTSINPVTNPNPSDPAAGMKGIKPNKMNLSISPTLDSEKGKLLDRLTNLSTIAATMTDMANAANPAQAEVAPSAIVSGVSGALQGAKYGPLGIVGGGLLGMMTGGLNAGTQREAYETQAAEQEKNKFKALRVAPMSFERGGQVKTEAIDPELEIPVQEEEGEIMLFPDGRLVDSMATKSHKQMPGKDVTDFIPDGSVIFSNSKKKMIDLSKVKDHVFTITKGHYSEDGNTPGETVTFGDIYGKKGKKTPATIAREVRDSLPVIEEPKEQYEIETNAENLRKRAELLLPIMQMQEGVYKKFEYEKPMIFEKGGVARKKKRTMTVPKYGDGTDGCGVGYKKDPDGNCVPDIVGMAALNQSELDNALFKIDDPDYRSIVENGVKSYLATLSGELPPETPPGQVKSVGAKAADQPVKSLGSTLVGGTDLPQSQQDLNIKGTLTPLPKINDTIFDNIDQKIATDQQNVNQQYKDNLASTQDLYRSQKFRNIGILATKLAGLGLQKPEVTPVTYGTEFVNQMYPKINESEIKQQLAPIQKSQNRVIQAVSDSGVSGNEIGSAVASTQARLIDAEGDIRSKAGQFNKNQEGRRFERLKGIIDLNRQNEVAAENATRGNRNTLTANIAGTGADALKAEGSLQEALANKRQELEKWKQENNNRISQNEFTNIVKREELKLKREWTDKIRTDLLDIVSKYIQQ